MEAGWVVYVLSGGLLKVESADLMRDLEEGFEREAGEGCHLSFSSFGDNQSRLSNYGLNDGVLILVLFVCSVNKLRRSWCLPA